MKKLFLYLLLCSVNLYGAEQQSGSEQVKQEETVQENLEAKLVKAIGSRDALHQHTPLSYIWNAVNSQKAPTMEHPYPSLQCTQEEGQQLLDLLFQVHKKGVEDKLKHSPINIAPDIADLISSFYFVQDLTLESMSRKARAFIGINW